MSASASRNLDQMSDHEESKERKESIGKEETVKAEKEESNFIILFCFLMEFFLL